MKHSFVGLYVGGILLASMAAVASADEALDEAIKKDRQIITGTWRVIAMEVNGSAVKEEEAKKLSVVNDPDGDWSLRSEGMEISKGKSTIDPTKTPKTIDFTPATGEAKG